MCLWIHHWVILQFLHQFFAVGWNTVLPGPDKDNEHLYYFKHKNWSTMIKAVDRKYKDEHVTLCNYHPRFSLVWLGFTQRPQLVSDDPEDGTYKLAADVKERHKSNAKILDNENTDIEKGKKNNKRKVGYKKPRDTKRKRK
jgi:hypothetical protein